MEEYKILVEIKFVLRKKFKINFFKKENFPIQSETFKIGINIKNIDNKIFPGGTLGKFRISSSDNKSLYEEIPKTFSIPTLNPDISTEIWLGNVTTHLYGLIWMSAPITPVNPQQTIITYQKDPGGGEPMYPHTNEIGDSSFIRSSAEIESSRTNFLILLLTALIFIETVFGLKNTIHSLFTLIGNIFIALGNSIK